MKRHFSLPSPEPLRHWQEPHLRHSWRIFSASWARHLEVTVITKSAERTEFQSQQSIAGRWLCPRRRRSQSPVQSNWMVRFVLWYQTIYRDTGHPTPFTWGIIGFWQSISPCEGSQFPSSFVLVQHLPLGPGWALSQVKTHDLLSSFSDGHRLRSEIREISHTLI